MKIEKKSMSAKAMNEANGKLLVLAGHLTGGSKKTHLSSFLRGQEITKDEVENLLNGRPAKVAVITLDDVGNARMLIEPDKILREIYAACSCPMALIMSQAAPKAEQPVVKSEPEEKKGSAKK